MSRAEDFKNYVCKTGLGDLIDPEWRYHSWVHPKAPKPRGKSVGRFFGRKFDLDDRRTVTRPDVMERQVPLTAEEINSRYIQEGAGKIALVGVAGRTNRIVGPVAEELKGLAQVEAIFTEDDPENEGEVSLSPEGIIRLGFFLPELVVVVEGIGTTGQKAASAAIAVQEQGFTEVSALITAQREPRLPELEKAGIEYGAISSISHDFRVYDYRNRNDLEGRELARD
jgi:orotate phosphoribosyltransferase